MDFSLLDVLGAAEQIIKADTSTNLGDLRRLEDEIAYILRSIDVSAFDPAGAKRVDSSEPFVLHDAAPPANDDVADLVIVGLFLALVIGSIALVNWYFRSTFGL